MSSIASFTPMSTYPLNQCVHLPEGYICLGPSKVCDISYQLQAFVLTASHPKADSCCRCGCTMTRRARALCAPSFQSMNLCTRASLSTWSAQISSGATPLSAQASAHHCPWHACTAPPTPHILNCKHWRCLRARVAHRPEGVLTCNSAPYAIV